MADTQNINLDLTQRLVIDSPMPLINDCSNSPVDRVADHNPVCRCCNVFGFARIRSHGWENIVVFRNHIASLAAIDTCDHEVGCICRGRDSHHGKRDYRCGNRNVSMVVRRTDVSECCRTANGGVDCYSVGRHIDFDIGPGGSVGNPFVRCDCGRNLVHRPGDYGGLDRHRG